MGSRVDPLKYLIVAFADDLAITRTDVVDRQTLVALIGNAGQVDCALNEVGLVMFHCGSVHLRVKAS